MIKPEPPTIATPVGAFDWLEKTYVLPITVAVPILATVTVAVPRAFSNL